MKSYDVKPRDEWVLDWPGMVVLVVTAVNWTMGVTNAITDGTTKQYEEKCTSDLMKIVDRVRGELTSLQRKTLGALVVMDVHARDVVANLAKKGVSSPTDFDWQAQLRSYWEDDPRGERENTTIMRIMNAEVEYGYEYLGKLVAAGDHPADGSMLPHADGGDSPHHGRRSGGPRGDRQDGDHEGSRQGARATVRGVQLLRLDGLHPDGQVFQGPRKQRRVGVLR